LKQVYNFNAGPAGLPPEVMQQVREELLDLQGTGLSILEISHRSKEYEHINGETQRLMKELMNIPSEYEVLFLQGGASTQFAMVPMNLLAPGSMAGYVHSGTWSGKAAAEAGKVGQTYIAASSEAERFRKVPDLRAVEIRPGTAYVHLTSNETIAGVQFDDFVEPCETHWVADMSSDILSRTIDVSKFSLIYAGAQKNLGPSGVTVVIVRRDVLDGIPNPGADRLPDIMNFRVHADNRSLYHTPPVFSVYVVHLVLQWISQRGGVGGREQRNRRKADLIYGAIDESGGFYEGLAHKESRSKMNVTFRIAHAEELEQRFLLEAERIGFVGLKGHRDAGHLRASLYNAVTEEQCRALASFMRDFQKRFG